MPSFAGQGSLSLALDLARPQLPSRPTRRTVRAAAEMSLKSFRVLTRGAADEQRDLLGYQSAHPRAGALLFMSWPAQRENFAVLLRS